MKNMNITTATKAATEAEIFAVEVVAAAETAATQLHNETVNFVTELGVELDKVAATIDRESKATAEGLRAYCEKLSGKNSPLKPKWQKRESAIRKLQLAPSLWCCTWR